MAAAAAAATLTADVSGLAAAFADLYGSAPHAIARAPGRVNLIGEHIDYNGYGVLPMAIRQACLVAISWQQGQDNPQQQQQQQQQLCMTAANLDGTHFPAATLQLADAAAGFPPGAPRWLLYSWAAFRGCQEFARARHHAVPSRGTMQLLVSGSVPRGSGLSSSSALVVASALALLALWDVPASPAEVADFTCRCERFVGTQGGGMDQAASLLAEAQLALLVEFNPLRTHPVRLPAGAVFVVANSLAPSHKAETAATRFNKRVLECRLAAMLLAKQLTPDSRGLAGRDSNSSSSSSALDFKTVKTLQQLEQALLLHRASASGQQDGTSASSTRHEQLELAVQQLLPQASYTLQQVIQQLGTTQAELLALLPPALQAAAQASPSGLLLRDRALHVYGEAGRVFAFRDVCQVHRWHSGWLHCKLLLCECPGCGVAPAARPQSDAPAGDKLAQLGSLMDASHASCAGLYQCSCNELDQLVAAAKAAGALGARLTGAGWGGCTVSLVREEDAPRFLAALKASYFTPLVEAGRLREEDLAECLFHSAPCQGAEVVLL